MIIPVDSIDESNAEIGPATREGSMGRPQGNRAIGNRPSKCDICHTANRAKRPPLDRIACYNCSTGQQPYLKEANDR